MFFKLIMTPWLGSRRSDGDLHGRAFAAPARAWVAEQRCVANRGSDALTYALGYALLTSDALPASRQQIAKRLRTTFRCYLALSLFISVQYLVEMSVTPISYPAQPACAP